MVYDGDSTDLTTSKYIYPSYSGYQSATGHTDYSGDVDYGSILLSSSGYYTIATTGVTTGGYIYDGTTSSWVNGSSGDYQTNLYLNASHTYYAFVYGSSTTGDYTVTVRPGSASSSYDGDSADLTTSKYICPSYSGYRSATGHTDYAGDVDYGCIYLSSSGYYTIATTGVTTGGYIYDGTTSSWVNGSSGDYQTNLYLNASHTYYAFVYGSSTTGDYTVSVTPGTSSSSSDYYYYGYNLSKLATNLGTEGTSFSFSFYASQGGQVEIDAFQVSTGGTYQFDISGTMAGTGLIYDATTGVASEPSTNSTQYYLYSGHQYFAGIYSESSGTVYIYAHKI